MNAFIEHHQQAIRFDYSCFDRILLNAIIQVLQNPACVVGFLKEKRLATEVTPAYFRAISTDYHLFVQALAEQRHVEIVQPPKDVRREEWVEPFYRNLQGQNGIAVILKSRENARVAVSFPRQGNHVELCNFFSAHLPTHISEFPTGWRVRGPEACLRRWRVPRRLANA